MRILLAPFYAIFWAFRLPLNLMYDLLYFTKFTWLRAANWSFWYEPRSIAADIEYQISSPQYQNWKKNKLEDK